jgi:ComF family protein
VGAICYGTDLQRKNYNMSILETGIGLLAPPECIGCGAEGLSLCLACSESEIIPFGERCYDCGKISERAATCERCKKTGSPHFVWVSTDYEKLAKELVQKYKFGQQRVASKSLSELMVQTFLAYNSDEGIKKMDYLVVAVPTATSRIRQRGFDHSALLARNIALKLNLQSAKVLGRLGQSRQVGTKRADRLAQAADNYYVRNPKSLKGRNILLIDDVITTGATLRAATKALRANGARRVDALIFAKRL